MAVADSFGGLREELQDAEDESALWSEQNFIEFLGIALNSAGF